MSYEVIISENVEWDLRNVFLYIAFELKMPETADRQIDRIEEM